MSSGDNMNLKVKVNRSSSRCSQTKRGAAAASRELCRMEFITNVSVIIDEALYKDQRRLIKILQPYRPEKKASCYVVRGTMEELDNLRAKLVAERRHSSPLSRRRTSQRDTSPSIKPVEVSGLIMAYIDQKCSKELNKIQGTSFVIETQPDLRTAHSKPSTTVWVTFRPKHVSVSPVRGEFVRQRFVTFYQRTASDLQVTSVPSTAHRDLQRTFPCLLFNPSHNRSEVTVTGPFLHIAKLKEFLSQNMQSSSKSPAKKGPARTPSSRTPRPPSTPSTHPEEETCVICMEVMVSAEKQTLRCKHSFCRSCLKTAFDYKPACPTCGELYGTLKGTQPEGGKMDVSKSSASLPGYEKYGTIIIHYYIPSGIQKQEHPNPGQPYEGASRTAYLPDSPEGRRTLKLLRRAFDQRVIFTVGRSTTSGRNNVVTWNDIHHKTATHGGPTHYAYPDPYYLSRVQDELKAKGIE